MDSVCSQLLRISLLVGLLAISGCYEPEPKPAITGELPLLVLPPAEAPLAQHRLVGRSVQGRPIMVQILGEGDDTVFVMGAIHGNEPAGATLVKSLVDYLRYNRDLLEGRRVVMMPVANPDGLAAGTRENVRRIDLNRNFDTPNRENDTTNGLRPLSEPESHALQSAIKQYNPSRIVSIHQPLTCIDYDGPGRALATRMAQYCDLPLKKLGAKPGSLGSYTGESLGIATITVELPKEASKLTEQELWEKYGKALLAAILYPQHPL